MAQRKRQRRRRLSGYQRRYRPVANNPAPADLAVDAILGALAAALRWMFRPLARLWGGGAFKPPRVALRDRPPVYLNQTTRPDPGRSKRPGTFPKAPPLPTRPRSRPDLAPYLPAGDPPPLEYRPAKRLMSKGEYAFWVPLYHATRGRFRLFCKVRLADVVRPPDRPTPGQKGFNSIKGYHVDFVLCDPKTTAPLLVVELDDRTHATDRQRELDRFKDRVLASAGIPIYRLPAQQAYDPVEIRQRIDALLDRRHE